MVNSEVQRFYNAAPDISIMQAGLKRAKHLYSREKLQSTFSYEYLSDDLDDWMQVLEKKTIPEKNKAVDLSMELRRSQKNLASVANTFQKQLNLLFRTFDESDDPTTIRERIDKAISFFSEETFQKLIRPCHLHIGEYALKKGTKAYVAATDNLLKAFWGRLNTLYELSFLEEKLWHGKVYSNDDLPKNPIRRNKKKGELSDTFEVTLELFRQNLKPKEIAKQRAMAQTTIESHLAKWVEKGEIDISSLMKPARLKKLLPFYDQMSDGKLTSFMKALPFNATFSELKLVVAYVKHKES